MKTLPLMNAALLLSAAIGFSIVANDFALARVSDPEPAPCSNFKKGSKKWKECMGQVRPDQSSQERFAQGYWLAKTGDYAKALEILKALPDQNNPDFLTMIGFATRHLGRIDEALGYYVKALAQNPNLTNTRQYLGEAYLQKNDVVSAKLELAEIKRLCGNSACEDYRLLDKAIADHEQRS